MDRSSAAPGPAECCSQAIAKADAVTGNAARLVRGAHAVPMQGAGATADTDPPCPKARARLDRRRARVSTPERRVSRVDAPSLRHLAGRVLRDTRCRHRRDKAPY